MSNPWELMLFIKFSWNTSCSGTSPWSIPVLHLRYRLRFLKRMAIINGNSVKKSTCDARRVKLIAFSARPTPTLSMLARNLESPSTKVVPNSSKQSLKLFRQAYATVTKLLICVKKPSVFVRSRPTILDVPRNWKGLAQASTRSLLPLFAFPTS